MTLLARRGLILGGAAAVANAAAVPRRADPSSNTWPSKTIAILVPFPAGGSADLSARLLAEHLKTVLGHPVVVENKAGCWQQYRRRGSGARARRRPYAVHRHQRHADHQPKYV